MLPGTVKIHTHLLNITKFHVTEYSTSFAARMQSLAHMLSEGGYCLVVGVTVNLKLKGTELTASLHCLTEYIVNISLSGGISYLYSKALFMP
jgi:hypothetical protein